MKGTLGHVSMGTGTFAPFDQVFQRSLNLNPREVAVQPLEDQVGHITNTILGGAVDGLVIWGGADISPSIYNEPVGPRTGASAELSYRDKIETAAVGAAIKMGIPLIGVCRGAQLLCAMSGGKLVQDVQGHHRDHPMKTNDGRSIVTTSIHHQMMYPFLMDEDKYDLIAWTAPRPLSQTYVGVDVDLMRDFNGMVTEPEVLYFHNTNALCIQGHPEFDDPHSEFVQYCNQLAREYFK